MADKIARVSVRTMVEFSLRGEDLVMNSDARRMLEGTLAHQARQRTAQIEIADYESEVSLSLDIETDGFPMRVQGRADGLFTRDGVFVIEEIKHSFDVRESAEEAHIAQCACYAHILCVQRKLENAVLRVLYVSREGESLCVFEQTHTAQDLHKTFDRYALPYARFAAQEDAHRTRRDASLAALNFPYGAYRAGQREMSKHVYIAIRDRRRLLAQAPTGIGKTAAVLFPALKALGEGKTTRIVYLTARTTGRSLAMNTLCAMNATLRCVEITAKDKICPLEQRRCSGEHCPYARGFFLRLDAAIDDALSRTEPLARAHIEEIARTHCVCPFELSLVLAQMADVIVCDYNYVFDPFVKLNFLGGAHMTVLCDEAHNLPDRVRDMLSAQLDATQLREWRRAWGVSRGRKTPVYTALTALIKALTCADDAHLPDLSALLPPAYALCDACTQALSLSQGEAGEIFLCMRAFCFAAERFNETYALLWDGGEKSRRIRLLALESGAHITQTTQRMRGCVFFSATLSPLRAFRLLLGAQEEDAALSLASPFPPENLCLMRLSLNTRYAAREQTAHEIAHSLAAMCRAHAGHYLFLFPSYAYLRMVREHFEACLPQAQVLCERAGMDERERAQMLGRFEAVSPTDAILAGFGVMGGNFSEGVDLPGEKLCGVAVIGVGLPMLCAERDALRDYYAAHDEDGYHLAYRVPGMIRVLQSAGRVIRSALDRGAVLLIDERFFTREYVDLMPAHFAHIQNCADAQEVEHTIKRFYTP